MSDEERQTICPKCAQELDEQVLWVVRGKYYCSAICAKTAAQ